MSRKMFHHMLAIWLGATCILLCVLPATAQPPLRILCDNWPPYQFESQGAPTGFSTSIVLTVFKKMDISIKSIEFYPWKRAVQELQQGLADAVISASYTEERTAFAFYPDEMLTDAPWIIWGKKEMDFRSLDDLKGKKIGVVLGYSYTPEFWEFIHAHCDVEQVPLDEINFKKLEAGRLDAVAAEYGNGIYLTKKLGLSTIKPFMDTIFKRQGLYIMFSKDSVSKGFVKQFSNELKLFKQTSEYSALLMKYFGDQPNLAPAP